MKIYCSRQDRNLFDYYVGKDIWVLVQFNSSEDYLKSKYWVRILRYNPAGYYEVNSVSNQEMNENPYDTNLDISNTLSCTESEMKLHLTKIWHLPPEKYEIVIPVEVKSTEELFTVN